MPYAVRRRPERDTLKLRDLDFNVYRWPGEDPQPVFLLHGWGDTAETYQFLADALPATFTLVAADMRGFGRTQRPDDGYWFPDYLADFDALLDRLSPREPVDIVAHSMGGNVAMLYSGVRPERVRRLVSLEGFGLNRTTSDQAPNRYRQWLDEIRDGSYFITYDSFETFATALGKRNPRTPRERLEFIAQSWGRLNAEGRVELWADPKHKRVNPTLYQREQAEACWAAITAPILLVMGDESEFGKRFTREFTSERLHATFKQVTVAEVRGSGHMLHHEQPEELARLIADFLTPVAAR
jgi:pimeloyl-ACP methyl ester carboxylesterase